MRKEMQKTGFYWQPLGGNNPDQISGHCYQYTVVCIKNRKKLSTTILVDLGKYDNHQALGIHNSVAAVPDIRALLSDKENPPKALLITHSHPDHLNGIIHYLRAGYTLPTIYAGKYTFMILFDLLREYHIPVKNWPKFRVIEANKSLEIGLFKIDVLAASHTCFDCFGFLIKGKGLCVYHTGDMKMDQSTCFRPSTNIPKLRETAPEIDYVVADFYGINNDGLAIREIDTYLQLVKIIKSQKKKRKVFIPVYPTHPEMYLIAFMAALKCRKNVVFYGNLDFFTYLKMIIEYGISFEAMAGERIKVLYSHNEEDLQELQNNYVVIGTYNEIPDVFDLSSKSCYAIITAATYFNPLKGQLNLHNIQFATVEKFPELQGYGHGFWGDIELLNDIMARHPVFIPTHCPVFMIDDVRELASYCRVKLISNTPKNNQIYKLSKNKAELVSNMPAKWLVAIPSSSDGVDFVEVWQKPTSGLGFLKRTISRRRAQKRFKAFLIKRKRSSYDAN